MTITTLASCILISVNLFFTTKSFDPSQKKKCKLILTGWLFISYFASSCIQSLDINKENSIFDSDKETMLGSNSSENSFLFNIFYLSLYFLSFCFCFSLFWINYFYSPREYQNLSFVFGVLNIFISIYIRNSLSTYHSIFIFITVSLFSLWTIWRSSISGQTLIYIVIYLFDIIIELFAFFSNEFDRVVFVMAAINIIMELFQFCVTMFCVIIGFLTNLDSFDEYIKLWDNKKLKECYYMIPETYIFLLALNLEIAAVSNLWVIKPFVWIFISMSLSIFLAYPDDDNLKFSVFAENLIGTFLQIYSIKAIWNLN